MNQSILEIKNLVTTFTSDDVKLNAVNDISFTVGKGETVGIVGESGSGKSVTSLSVMRLIPNPPGKITSGEIIYTTKSGEQIDLTKVSDAEMRRYRGNEIAMIFQEPMTSLNPVFTCGYQVAEALMLHKGLSKKEALQQTKFLFEQVQLPSPDLMLEKYPHQLSGGQKQRVMIAMAMCCKPKLLIADEPTTALDVTVQATILKLMKELQQQEQMSMIFITHDLGVIADIADKVLVMYKGKIVEQGTVDEIFYSPKHPYTKSLLACRPPLDKRLSRLPTVNDFMSENENGEVIEKVKTIAEVTDKFFVDEVQTEKRKIEIERAETILSVQNISTYFSAKQTIFGKTIDWTKAVDDVSFEVKKGETLGLVGESGCGKTTLGRTIIRLIEPTAGKIIYDGNDLRTLSDAEMRKMRKRMQIIFQDPYSSLNPRMTIGAAILEPMQVHKLHENEKMRKEKVMELLHKVNLKPEHFNRYPHEFSGGQRQRVVIARALAVNPEFIICDESVSALDVSVQAQVLNLLMQLREEFQFTYIFISHDLSVVKFMSDRMIVMNKGKIEEQGSADEIYYNPQQDYTKRLIAAIPKGKVIV